MMTKQCALYAASAALLALGLFGCSLTGPSTGAFARASSTFAQLPGAGAALPSSVMGRPVGTAPQVSAVIPLEDRLEPAAIEIARLPGGGVPAADPSTQHTLAQGLSDGLPN